MTAYYNEIDPAAAHVLEHMIRENVIAPGVVDTRSIKEVEPNDLDGFTQCHFFAGGGLWSVAARIAGWPDSEPIWTGSCPCQPHSAAASDRKRGFRDERDLWPEWFRLIEKCRPKCVFGEQVDDNAAWIDRMLSQMEGSGFAVASIDLPACSVDAPHVRMRNYTVAYADCSGCGEQGRSFAMAQEHLSTERSGSRARVYDHTTTGELGKRRRSEPGVRLLYHDIPGRVDLLRIGGNAIVPEAAKEVIGAFMDVYGLPSEWRTAA